MNIVKLIGEDALPDDQKVIFQGARLIQEDFLQQSAFDSVDTYSPVGKQVLMLQIILRFIEKMKGIAATHRIPVYRIMELPVLEEMERMKYTYGGDDPGPFKDILKRLEEQFDNLLKREV
jgi:V/A-type H+-transporting ATPase subunit A